MKKLQQMTPNPRKLLTKKTFRNTQTKSGKTKQTTSRKILKTKTMMDSTRTPKTIARIIGKITGRTTKANIVMTHLLNQPPKRHKFVTSRKNDDFNHNQS